MNNLFGFDLQDFNSNFPGVYDVYSSKCNMPSPTPAQKEECCKVACDICKTGNCTTGGVSTCLLNCPPDLVGPVNPYDPPSPDGPYGPSPNGPVVNPVVPPATPQVGIFSNLSTLQIVTFSVGTIIILALIILIIRNMKARRSISFY